MTVTDVSAGDYEVSAAKVSSVTSNTVSYALPTNPNGSGPSGGSVSATSRPQLVLETDPVARIAAVGDIADNVDPDPFATPAKDRYDLVAALIAAGNYDKVLTLGDTQYPCGEYTNFTNHFDEHWGIFKTQGKIRPAVGNHDVTNRWNGPGSTPVTNATWSQTNGGEATVYLQGTTHELLAGDKVTVSGIAPAGYNVTDATITSVSTGTDNYIRYTVQNNPGTYTPGTGSVLGTSVGTACPGNYDDPGLGYFKYFNGTGPGPNGVALSGAAGPTDEGFYTFNYDDYWRVTAANSSCSWPSTPTWPAGRTVWGGTADPWNKIQCEHTIGSYATTKKQFPWLSETLAQAAAPEKAGCQLVYYHIPLFSQGEHGHDASAANSGDWWGSAEGSDPTGKALFQGFDPDPTIRERKDVDVVLTAHDHNYQRFKPIKDVKYRKLDDPGGGTHDRTEMSAWTVATDGTGIRQFIVGSGGKSTDKFGATRNRTYAVTNAIWSSANGGEATLTIGANHDVEQNDKIKVENVDPDGYNTPGLVLVKSVSVADGTVTYALDTNPQTAYVPNTGTVKYPGRDYETILEQHFEDDKPHPADETKQIEALFGYVELTLRTDGYDWAYKAYINRPGSTSQLEDQERTLDVGSGTC